MPLFEGTLDLYPNTPKSLTHWVYEVVVVFWLRMVHRGRGRFLRVFGSSSIIPGALYFQKQMLEMPLKYFSSLLNTGLTLLFIKNKIPWRVTWWPWCFFSSKFASLVNVMHILSYLSQFVVMWPLNFYETVLSTCQWNSQAWPRPLISVKVKCKALTPMVKVLHLFNTGQGHLYDLVDLFISEGLCFAVSTALCRDS